MGALIDTCVWIDFFHPKSTKALRQIAADQIDREDAVICEPVFAEIFHGLPSAKAGRVIEHLQTVPLLPTPHSLWKETANFIRTCTSHGRPVGTMDAVIAVIAKHHSSEVVTFDRGFEAFGVHCQVSLHFLDHPKR